MAKRAKESKFNFKIWIPIICIVVVGITFYMIYDIRGKIEEKDLQNTINNAENTIGEEGNLNETEENRVDENTIHNEVADETQNTLANTTSQNTANNSNTTQMQPGITDKKQKAIELVKKEWGADHTVDFVFDYINENGEYVVAVKDGATATVKYYFRVNLETQTVELD